MESSVILTFAHVLRSTDLYEKYFVIQKAADAFGDSMSKYDAHYSVDFNGDPLRGMPVPAAIRKFSFCAAPGTYTMHAVDTAEGELVATSSRADVVAGQSP